MFDNRNLEANKRGGGGGGARRRARHVYKAPLFRCHHNNHTKYQVTMGELWYEMTVTACWWCIKYSEDFSRLVDSLGGVAHIKLKEQGKEEQ